jgi:hypothetical protein
VVDFLGHLLRCLPGKLLVIWDGLPAHRAALVRDFIRAQRGRLTIEWLPGYYAILNKCGPHHAQTRGSLDASDERIRKQASFWWA